MDLRRYYPIGIVLGLVVAFQLAMSAAGTLYYLREFTYSVYYSLVVLGLCLLMGYAGQISLGHAGFFAIGGYTAAVLTTYNLVPYKDTAVVRLLDGLGLLLQRVDLYGTKILYVAPWVALAAALIVTAIIAFVIGIPVIRLKGHYLAMATLGFGVIVYYFVKGTPLFGEADGTTGVPHFGLVGGLRVANDVDIRIPNYYFACFLLFVALVVSLNLINSRVGRALRSIHESEEAANALGVDTGRYKLYTFVLSALLAAIGGVFLTHYKGSIDPNEAGVMRSVRYVAIVAVGGMANIWGAVLMGLLLNFLSLRNVFGSYDDAVFGIILIVIMLFAPQGILRIPQFRQIVTWPANLIRFRKKPRAHGAP